MSGNETRLEDVVKEKKGEIKDVEKRIASGFEEAKETKLAEIEKVVKESKDEITGAKNETNLVLDVLENVVNVIKNQQKNAEDVSKQALVSALVCEYQRLLSVKKYCTDSTLVSVFSVK